MYDLSNDFGVIQLSARVIKDLWKDGMTHDDFNQQHMMKEDFLEYIEYVTLNEYVDITHV